MKTTQRLYEAAPPHLGAVPRPPIRPGHRRRQPGPGEVPVVPAAGLPVPVRLRPGVRLRRGEGPGPGADADLLRQRGRHPGRRDEGPPGLHGPPGHHGGAGVRRAAGPVQPVLHPLYALLCAAGGPAEIIAAILSCSWSYAEIGQRLAAIPGAADHPFYGEWIRSYAGEDYPKDQRRPGGADGPAGGGLHRGGVPAAGGDLRQLQPVRAGASGRWPGPWSGEPCTCWNFKRSPTSIPVRTLTSSTA